MKKTIDRAQFEAQISTIQQGGSFLTGFVQGVIIVLLIALGTMFMAACKTSGMGCYVGSKTWQGRK